MRGWLHTKLVSLKGLRGKERKTRARRALLQGLLIGARGVTLNGTWAGIEANETSGERRPWPNGQNLHSFSPSV